MRLGIFWVLAAALWFYAPSAARADDAPEMACDDTAMKFSGSDYAVTCADLSDSMVNVQNEAVGAIKAHQLKAVSDSDNTILVVIDYRLLGGRIYFERSGLEQSVAAFFSGLQISDWSVDSAVSGFEVGQFTGKTKTGVKLNCIGYRREVSRHLEGLSRIVVGIACAGGGREHAYDALKNLDAPGS